jgi:hypothetical protein
VPAFQVFGLSGRTLSGKFIGLSSGGPAARASWLDDFSVAYKEQINFAIFQ